MSTRQWDLDKDVRPSSSNEWRNYYSSSTSSASRLSQIENEDEYDYALELCADDEYKQVAESLPTVADFQDHVDKKQNIHNTCNGVFDHQHHYYQDDDSEDNNYHEHIHAHDGGDQYQLPHIREIQPLRLGFLAETYKSIFGKKTDYYKKDDDECGANGTNVGVHSGHENNGDIEQGVTSPSLKHRRPLGQGGTVPNPSSSPPTLPCISELQSGHPEDENDDERKAQALFDQKLMELSERRRWAKASSRRSSMSFLHEQGFRMAMHDTTTSSSSAGPHGGVRSENNPLLTALSKQNGGISVRLHQPHCRAEACTLYSHDGGHTIQWKGLEKSRDQKPNVCCLVDIFLETFYAHDYSMNSGCYPSCLRNIGFHRKGSFNILKLIAVHAADRVDPTSSSGLLGTSTLRASKSHHNPSLTFSLVYLHKDEETKRDGRVEYLDIECETMDQYYMLVLGFKLLLSDSVIRTALSKGLAVPLPPPSSSSNSSNKTANIDASPYHTYTTHTYNSTDRNDHTDYFADGCVATTGTASGNVLHREETGRNTNLWLASMTFLHVHPDHDNNCDDADGNDDTNDIEDPVSSLFTTEKIKKLKLAAKILFAHVPSTLLPTRRRSSSSSYHAAQESNMPPAQFLGWKAPGEKQYI